ncbi:MAG TPA: ABC transporter ATP-binding protein [Thermohalobaculum sp.]|nr:ABC transporter ATP-binding protein [Thermohalobaculum sp.]
MEAVAVSKVYDAESASPVRALDDVSLEIRDNEFFTLLGPSGCGKTTLLRLIAGFEHPTSGMIRLHGKDISFLPPYRRSVNTVFQSYALFPHMTVAQNIGFGLEMQRRPKAEVAATVDEMLGLVRMEELKNRRTDAISGGQQQRVALARALAPRPEVLLLDEPLSALDYKLRKDMQIELKRLQLETGITFIFVTHDQEEALTMSDRLAVMSQGRILQIGSPREIYNHPSERFVANFIGDTNFLEADVGERGDGRARLALDHGGEIEASLPDSAGERVTIVVRPERAQLTDDPDAGILTGTIEHIVYVGTDTHYRVRLSGGGIFSTRAQNVEATAEPRREGQEVGIAFAPEAVQVLRD